MDWLGQGQLMETTANLGACGFDTCCGLVGSMYFAGGEAVSGRIVSWRLPVDGLGPHKTQKSTLWVVELCFVESWVEELWVGKAWLADRI